MTPEESRKLIDASGGNTAFALLLALPINPATVSRVGQWKRRGIPSDIVSSKAKELAGLRKSASRRGML